MSLSRGPNPLIVSQNPVPAEAWEGVLDAGSAKDGCLQRNYFSNNRDVRGVEDCLYLNVYRPKVTGFLIHLNPHILIYWFTIATRWKSLACNVLHTWWWFL